MTARPRPPLRRRLAAAFRPPSPICTGARRCSISARVPALISARRVGPTGKAIGVNTTDEMLDLARPNAAEAEVDNAEIKRPLEDDHVEQLGDRYNAARQFAPRVLVMLRLRANPDGEAAAGGRRNS